LVLVVAEKSQAHALPFASQVLADLGQNLTEMELEDMIILVDKTGASFSRISL
jgi:hypothetical protein